jgi:hypothetical protein
MWTDLLPGVHVPRYAENGLFKGPISRAISWLLIAFPIYFWLYEVIVGYGQPRRKTDREKSERGLVLRSTTLFCYLFIHACHSSATTCFASP